MPVRGEWSSVERLRSSILNCLTAAFGALPGLDSVAIVVSELLENAVKYGAREGSQPALRLRVWGQGPRASVSVDNPIDPDDPNLGELFRTIEWIESQPSAADAYRARLLAVAASPDVSSGRLGLARIACEGDCSIAADVTDRRLRVTAELQIS